MNSTLSSEYDHRRLRRRRGSLLSKPTLIAILAFDAGVVTGVAGGCPRSHIYTGWL
ncbi:hypothetical protein BCAR13_270033 [Paraburkholderia caribensis]|nr:hypothetical protein BCAR13_270033 [Paraburkholderia caribensis]